MSSAEFKINIMSLDDLVPDTLGAIKKPAEKNVSETFFKLTSYAVLAA